MIGGMGSTALRFSDPNEMANCHACLATKITNSKINIFSDCNINEIHLNIFPPTATYVRDGKAGPANSSVDDILPRSCLNIDVHEKRNQKVVNDSEKVEAKRRMSTSSYSHISFKRCDSILHISIGNSSKIIKRHKRQSWLFANLWKFSHKRKSPLRRRCLFSPELNRDSIYQLNDKSLNLVNDELMITINNQNYSHNQPSSSSTTTDNFTTHSECYHKQMERELSENFCHSNDEIGANELDCYMNEIKRRERR
jgi:hypothetical protein